MNEFSRRFKKKCLLNERFFGPNFQKSKSFYIEPKIKKNFTERTILLNNLSAKKKNKIHGK